VRHPARLRLAGADGFTLTELLVAMAAGVVVVLAASSVMIVALHTESRVQDSVIAVQQGRTAMEQLLQELNSGCLTNDVSPVQPTTATGITPVVSSDGSDLVFVSGVGDHSSNTPTEHVVSVQNGALIDMSYANTGGQPPALNTAATWTFNSTPTARHTLLEHVAQVNSTTPIFQYYSFSNSSNPNANSLLNAVPLSPLPLSAAAASVAQVDINWQALPSDGLSDASRATVMSDSVVFRFTPASPTDLNYPCD
jgi:prepilin-type N-terminal cleavage/methylation domain-containing protein